MRYELTIKGVDAVIMHSAAGLDPKLPANLEKAEIARKKGTNRTAADDARLRELEVQLSLWLDDEDAPTIPPQAFRACIEQAARKLKQGPQVREGLIVARTLAFDYDRERYGTTVEELIQTTAFTVPVVVQRSRIMRTRARFDLEWSARFELDADDELVDATQLETWCDIGGRRLGIGDWRPAKSGNHGRFELAQLTPIG